MDVTKALFPLSGDPITNGHLNIIERASKWVKEIVVVVLDNYSKTSILTMEERVEIIKLCIKSRGLKNVSVDSYDGLLSDYATRSGIFHIIRGIRNTNDLEYEIYLEYGHKRQNPRLELIYFLSEPQYRTTSSSIARSILKKGGQIKDYVPLQAKKAMEEKLMGQYKLIVTGGIACGKSYVTQELMHVFSKAGYRVHNIDFDLLVKNIYDGLSAGEYPQLAMEMTHYLGEKILQEGRISQKKVSQEVFTPIDSQNQKVDSEDKLQTLLGLLRPYINSLYHQELTSKQGFIFLNIPLAAESEILFESNNNVLLVTCSPQTQKERLKSRYGQREINSQEVQLRIERAGTCEMKQKLIEKTIEREKVGKLIVYPNQGQNKIKELKQEILGIFPYLKSEDD